MAEFRIMLTWILCKLPKTVESYIHNLLSLHVCFYVDRVPRGDAQVMLACQYHDSARPFIGNDDLSTSTSRFGDLKCMGLCLFCKENGGQHLNINWYSLFSSHAVLCTLLILVPFPINIIRI